MAWVTTIGPDAAQVEYRLEGGCGCDAQAEYRLGAGADLEWIGRGLPDVGLAAGDPVDKGAARLLMDGRDPRTGERLVAAKVAVDPRGKLGARVLVDAIHLQAVERGVPVAELLGGDDRLVKRFARLERGVRREGETHRVPVVDAERLADVAGIDVADLYEEGHLVEARAHAGARVRVGNRGYDMTLDLPKSYSALFGLAAPGVAAELRATYLEAARETVAALEDWAVYAMAGHHGDGQSAQRVATAGALGWMAVHESARPVAGEAGDPHLHVHVTLANMALCADGEWRTVGAGGRDIHRHAHAADALLKARLRQLTNERFGMRWERSETTGAWEVAGVPLELRVAMSRRSTQVAATVGADATVGVQKLAAAQLAERKQAVPAGDVRAAWRTRAETVVADVDAMVAAAMPGPPAGPPTELPDPGPRVPGPGEIAAHIWRADGGLTATRKAVTRADVLAAVMDAVPGGLTAAAAAERLTDDVLAVPGHAVALPSEGARHLTNAQRFTHCSVLDAERTIVETATARLSEGAAELTQAAAELAVGAFEAGRGFVLSAEQRAVVARLLTAGHGLDVVVGVAGAGKTTLMAAARAGWEAAGLRVAGASTAAVAASNLQAEAGIASGTVASWLADITAGGDRMAAADVLVLDEAGVLDDRALAALLTAAAEHGTKVVAVGDWQQLRAIGIGGGFRRAHQLVAGLALTENRRQRDPAVRHLLDVWRDGGRRVTLAGLAEHGHVHAVETAEQARTAMLSAWWDQRVAHTGDAHDLLENLLVLAARNEDVEALNAGARELLRADGQLTAGRSYALAGGGRVEFAPGDLVRVRRNDYGSRRPGGVDVLNGYRAEVIDATAAGVRIRWRRTGPDGHEHQEAVVSARTIAAGGLSHGYALTIAAAQGLTAEHALVYGPGADAYSLYPAITRAREASHLWLPAQVVESETTRARLGEARAETELLHRAVTAYAASLDQDPDGMVGDELLTTPDEPVRQHAKPVAAVDDRAAEQQRTAGTVPPPREPDQQAREQQRRLEREERHRERLRVQREAEVPSWRSRPYGRVPTGHLEARAEKAGAEASRTRAEQQRLAAEADAMRAALGTALSRTARRYADRVQQLGDAEARLARADHADRQADALNREIRDLYESNARDMAISRRIDARADTRTAAATFQRGRLRADADLLRGQMNERVQQIDTLRARATGLRSAAEDNRRQVEAAATTLEGSRSYGRAAERLAAVRADLPAYAMRSAAAEQRRWERVAQQADRAGEEAATWDAQAAGVRAEAEIRSRLSPARQTRESLERTTAAAQAAAERTAAARQAEIQRQHEYRPPSPTIGRGGPGLGL